MSGLAIASLTPAASAAAAGEQHAPAGSSQAATPAGTATASKAGPTHVKNRMPSVPTALSIDSCYLVCASPAVVRSGTPQLSATVADPDGGTLGAEFQVYEGSRNRQVATSRTAVTGVPSGSVATWRLAPVTGTSLPDGTYRWRVRACDISTCGGYSGWSTFTVTTRAVPQPTVAATPYVNSSTGTWNGGVGQPGSFEFGPNGAPDVVEYVYSLNSGNYVTVAATSGGSVTESITPTRDGLNVLQVQARNSAGITSEPAVYQFLVAPTVGGSWAWPLDENAGTTAASVPNTKPAAFSQSGVAWISPGKDSDAAVSLTGTGELTTGSSVLDTAAPAGFTVAARVRLTDLSGGVRTVVSQDGTNTSMFALQYRDDLDVDADMVPDQTWCFTVKAADTADAAPVSACTRDYVVPGEWVNLIGAYDRPSNKIKLYVNGTPDIGGSYAEADYAEGWPATGTFAIGRGWQGAAPADRWIGDLDDVRADAGLWSDTEIMQYGFAW